MDQWLVRKRLAEAERHLSQSDEYIARQTEIIDELQRGGHSIDLAVDLLDTFHTTRATHLAQRDRIRKELEREL